jgi:hypothetical protein
VTPGHARTEKKRQHGNEDKSESPSHIHDGIIFPEESNPENTSHVDKNSDR